MNLFLRTSVILAVATAALVASAQTVVNPGFETFDFTGYTVTPAAHGSFFGVYGGNGAAHSGKYGALFLASDGIPDTISQSIDTIPGQTYLVSYYLQEDPDPFNPAGKHAFTASFGGTSQTISSLPLKNTYTLETLFTTATSTTTFLSFGGYYENGLYHLDDISVIAAPVPEPCSIAALGLGAIALLRRRKCA